MNGEPYFYRCDGLYDIFKGFDILHEKKTTLFSTSSFNHVRPDRRTKSNFYKNR